MKYIIYISNDEIVLHPPSKFNSFINKTPIITSLLFHFQTLYFQKLLIDQVSLSPLLSLSPSLTTYLHTDKHIDVSWTFFGGRSGWLLGNSELDCLILARIRIIWMWICFGQLAWCCFELELCEWNIILGYWTSFPPYLFNYLFRCESLRNEHLKSARFLVFLWKQK